LGSKPNGWTPEAVAAEIQKIAETYANFLRGGKSSADIWGAKPPTSSAGLALRSLARGLEMFAQGIETDSGKNG
jgi:hypothetical protein